MADSASDVIVIGAGIVGCATAYFLAREGRQVTLFERDAVGGHASGFAFGGIIPSLGDVTHDAAGPLSSASERLHAELGESLSAESGVDFGYRRKPAVILALNDADESALQAASSALSRDPHANVRWVSRGELTHIEARVSEVVRGGLYVGDAHELDPHNFTMALWKAAEKLGARQVASDVTGLVTADGRVTGVESGGERHMADAVVAAAGPWTGGLLSTIGVNIPISPLKGQILRMKADDPPMTVSLWWRGDYATTKPDGLMWIGATEEHAGFDENLTDAARDQILSSVVEVLPYLATAELVRQTACLRPVMSDGLPVIGPIPGMDGLYVATGAGRNGIKLGPGMGRAVADLVQGRAPCIDVSRLGADRFTGS
ncbi:MAG: FAD-dependent oxidoreductase [Dehalococcoidia bacterium]